MAFTSKAAFAYPRATLFSTE